MLIALRALSLRTHSSLTTLSRTMSTGNSTIQAVFQPDPTSRHLELKALPRPSPKVEQHVIAVRATAACRDELGWEEADPDVFKDSKRERVPGVEGSGVVEEAPASSPFKRGDQVFWATDAWETGAARSLTLVEGAQLAHKPESLDWVNAAATPLSALSAWQGLFEHGSLDDKAITAHDGAAKKANAQRVLITGAGGGVGSWAVKLAHAAGAHVIALCSPGKAEAVKKFGAAEIIDYTSTSVDKWAQSNERVDLVFDCAGGKVLPTLWGAVKDGGSFVAITGEPAESQPPSAKPKVAKWFLVNTRRNLPDIAKLVDEAKLTPLVDSVLPFDQFAEVWRKADEGKTTGKVVLTVSKE